MFFQHIPQMFDWTEICEMWRSSQHLKLRKKTKTAMCTVSFHNFLSEAVLASDSSLNFWCTQDLKLSADTSGSTVYALRSSKPEPCLSLSHPPYSTRTQHSKSILQGAFVRDGQYTSCSSHQPLLYCPRFHNSKEKPDCNRSHIPCFFFFFFSLSGNILFCQTSIVRYSWYVIFHYEYLH